MLKNNCLDGNEGVAMSTNMFQIQILNASLIFNTTILNFEMFFELYKSNEKIKNMNSSFDSYSKTGRHKQF